MKQSSYFLCVNEFVQENGILSVIEENRTIPFSIRRCFFIYDLKPGDKRGVHAVDNQQCIFLLSGSCTVMVHDGKEEVLYKLSAPMEGVYIAPMMWREIRDCSPGSRIAVFSDKHYDPDAYIRDFDVFLQYCADIEKEEM